MCFLHCTARLRLLILFVFNCWFFHTKLMWHRFLFILLFNGILSTKSERCGKCKMSDGTCLTISVRSQQYRSYWIEIPRFLMSFIGPNWIGHCQEKIICVQSTSTFLRKSILHSVVALEWWETLVSTSSFLCFAFKKKWNSPNCKMLVYFIFFTSPCYSGVC